MKMRAIIVALLICISFNAQAAEVRSTSGIVIRVAESARAAMQCVVDFVERAGVKIKYMRGFGAGTVRGSLHPSGQAIDINQYARNRTNPTVPAHVSNAAGDSCGVVSGARWGNADNGHWNLGTYAHRHSNETRTAVNFGHRHGSRKFAKLNGVMITQNDRYTPI